MLEHSRRLRLNRKKSKTAKNHLFINLNNANV